MLSNKPYILFQDYIDKTNELEMLCKSNREKSSDWNKLLSDLSQAKKSVLEASVYALQVGFNTDNWISRLL